MTEPAPADHARRAPAIASPAPLLQVEDLVKHYRLPRERLFAAAPVVEALRGVSFTMRPGRSLGIVGESGSGKSTLARQVMALERPTAGRVVLLGRDLATLGAAELRAARRDFQMVFQDPYGSLDPRQTVRRIVAEPLATMPAAAARLQVEEALEAVGLRPSDADKYPHEFSGGQRQRIAIARALITRPRLIVADEPVSALDVSVQAQVLNLLQDLQAQFGVALLLISHDLAVVDHLCDEVLVLYAGRVVEQGAPEILFGAAAHPYTRALIAAVPQAPGATVRVSEATAQDAATPGAAAGLPHPRAPMREAAASTALSPSAAPAPSSRVGDDLDAACAYVSRCAWRQAVCSREAPALRPVANAASHRAACHFAETVMTRIHPGTHPAKEPTC